jgi:hypothetical protein
MVGRLGFAPSSRRLRAGTSLSKFATQSRHENRSRSVGRRSQICEALADTGISHRVKMVRAAGNAPACSCSRSKRLTFRLRSDELPSALKPISDHYFDRARSLPAHQVQLGKMKWSSIRVSRPVFRFGRPACISQHLCSLCRARHNARKNWSPVMELHHSARFCRPLPGLLGQRDI